MFQGLNLQGLQGWASLISIALNFALALALWSFRRAIVEQCGKLLEPHAKKLTDHDRRIQRAEGHITEIQNDLRVLPTGADIARLEGKIDGAVALMSRTESAVERVESYFLERGVKGA